MKESKDKLLSRELWVDKARFEGASKEQVVKHVRKVNNTWYYIWLSTLIIMGVLIIITTGLQISTSNDVKDDYISALYTLGVEYCYNNDYGDLAYIEILSTYDKLAVTCEEKTIVLGLERPIE